MYFCDGRMKIKSFLEIFKCSQKSIIFSFPFSRLKLKRRGARHAPGVSERGSPRTQLMSSITSMRLRGGPGGTRDRLTHGRVLCVARLNLINPPRVRTSERASERSLRVLDPDLPGDPKFENQKFK